MLYVIDTDVISETARSAPAQAVVDWLADQPAIVLASVTVYELASGIEKMAAGRKRRLLDAWFASLLAKCEVIPFNGDGGLEAARLERDARQRGRAIDTSDLFILASAKSHGVGVATRNVDHFRGFGVSVYDPFSGKNSL